MIEVGNKAPLFEAKGTLGEVNLGAMIGTKPIVLMFYPFTFTGVCEGELCELRDKYDTFRQANVDLMSVSCDSVPVLAKYSELQSIKYQMVSDFWPHGQIAKQYGCFDENLGCAVRASYLIDKNGNIAAGFQSGSLGEARQFEQYVKALTNL